MVCHEYLVKFKVVYFSVRVTIYLAMEPWA